MVVTKVVQLIQLKFILSLQSKVIGEIFVYIAYMYKNVIDILNRLWYNINIEVCLKGMSVMDEKNNIAPAEKPKRKTHTSTAVKRRYNNKVYSRAYADLPSDLVAAFKNIIAAKGITIAAVLRKAIEQYIEDNKGNAAKRKYNNKETLRVYADLPKELVTEFREIAEENSESAAAVLRKAIEQYIEDNKGNASKRKYNSKTSARISAELPKALVSEFREVVAENSETAAGVLRKAVEKYVQDNE